MANVELERRLRQAVRFELAPEFRDDFRFATFDAKNKALHGAKRYLKWDGNQVILM